MKENAFFQIIVYKPEIFIISKICKKKKLCAYKKKEARVYLGSIVQKKNSKWLIRQ